MALQERLRPRQDDRDIENRRPTQEDRRREYDNYHPGYTSTTTSKAYTPLSEQPSRRMAIPPTGRKNYYDDRRPTSPVTSFLDQIELGNGRLPKVQDSMPQDYGTDRHSKSPKPNNQKCGHQFDRDTSASMAVPSTTLKRPAQSPIHTSKDDNAIKRLRKTVQDGDSSSKPETSANPAASIQPNIEQAGHQLQEYQPVKDVKLAGKSLKPELNLPTLCINGHETGNIRLYVNSSTQTENVQIPFSKLAVLQEEEAIAQAKHEADMTRRKQALALELEHERKVLELRHRFELPTAKRAQSASATNDSYSPEHSAPFQVPKPAVNNNSGTEVMSTIQNASSGHDRTQRVQDSSITGTARNAPTAPQECPKPESVGQMRFTTAEPASDPHSPPNAKDQKSTTGILDLAKGKGQDQSVLESKDQHGSSSSASVQIKTSLSPRPVEREKSDVNKPRWPKMTHLTCYFWKNGYCTKSAAECSYAHHDTGVVATAPDTMRRMRRDGVYHGPRGW
ncbi:MAG: hypothetical protein Q9188_002208 [Gyalolechia gomerana]